MTRRATHFGRRQRLGVVLGALTALATGLGLQALDVTPSQSWTAAVVLTMAVLWITEPVPLWVTALLPIALFPLTGAAPAGEVALRYVEPLNFLFLGGMWIAACMEQWGLHRRMALGIVDRVGSGPRRIVLGFMIATAFCSLWISNTAAAVMIFPIGMAVLDNFADGRDPRASPDVRQLGCALMLGVAWAASIGGIGSKIGTGPNLIFIRQVGAVLPDEIGFLTWMWLGLPVVILVVPLAWLYLVRIAVPLPAANPTQGHDAIRAARKALGAMSRGERVALAGFLSAALLWTLRAEIDLGFVSFPGWPHFVPWSWSDLLGRDVSTLPFPLSGLFASSGHESLIALAVGIALLLFPVQLRPMRTALSPRRAARIQWSLLTLLGGGFAMAHGIQACGLSEVIAGWLRGVDLPVPFVALLLIAWGTTALSEVASNTATCSILLPILAVSGDSFGVHPAVAMLAATLAASFGLMLPAGTPPNAVAYSSGYIEVTRMAKCGFIVDVLGGVVIALVCTFVVPVVLGLPG